MGFWIDAPFFVPGNSGEDDEVNKVPCSDKCRLSE
jgi:hypothetical protein